MCVYEYIYAWICKIVLKCMYVYKCVYMYSVVMNVCTCVYRYVHVHRSECGRGMKYICVCVYSGDKWYTSAYMNGYAYDSKVCVCRAYLYGYVHSSEVCVFKSV